MSVSELCIFCYTKHTASTSDKKISLQVPYPFATAKAFQINSAFDTNSIWWGWEIEKLSKLLPLPTSTYTVSALLGQPHFAVSIWGVRETQRRPSILQMNITPLSEARQALDSSIFSSEERKPHNPHLWQMEEAGWFKNCPLCRSQSLSLCIFFFHEKDLKQLFPEPYLGPVRHKASPAVPTRVWLPLQMQYTQAEGISQLPKLFSMQYASPALQTGDFSHAEPAQLCQHIFQMQTTMGAVYF